MKRYAVNIHTTTYMYRVCGYMNSILLKIINLFIGLRNGSSFPCGFLLSERIGSKNISLVRSVIIWSKFHGVSKIVGELSFKVGRVVY